MLLPNPMGFHGKNGILTYIFMFLFMFLFMYLDLPKNAKWLLKGINSTFLRVYSWHPFGRCW